MQGFAGARRKTVPKASPWRKGPRREHRRKHCQQAARRPPAKCSPGSEASNEARSGTAASVSARTSPTSTPRLHASSAAMGGCLGIGIGARAGNSQVCRGISTCWPESSCATTAATSTRSACTTLQSIRPTSQRPRSSAFAWNLGPTTSARPRRLPCANKYCAQARIASSLQFHLNHKKNRLGAAAAAGCLGSFQLYGEGDLQSSGIIFTAGDTSATTAVARSRSQKRSPCRGWVTGYIFASRRASISDAHASMKAF